MKNLLFSVVAVVLLARPVAAQTVARTPPVTRTELYELVLKDGSRVFGTIESETDGEVVVRTQAVPSSRRAAPTSSRFGRVRTHRAAASSSARTASQPPVLRADRAFAEAGTGLRRRLRVPRAVRPGRRHRPLLGRRRHAAGLRDRRLATVRSGSRRRCSWSTRPRRPGRGRRSSRLRCERRRSGDRLRRRHVRQQRQRGHRRRRRRLRRRRAAAGS